MASRILLADDSITIQKVVNLTFADEGIEVVAVSNGDLAERRLSEVNPDLVLADIFMPGKNGYELCESIKESSQFRNVPVVLLVGAFEPFDQAEARRVRADAHLTKPFESRTLVETVRRLISASWRTTTGPIAPSQPAGHDRRETVDATAPGVAQPPLAASLPDKIDLSAMMEESAAPAPVPMVRNTGELASPSPVAHEDVVDLGSVDAPPVEAVAASLTDTSERFEPLEFSPNSDFSHTDPEPSFGLDAPMIQDFETSQPVEPAASPEAISFETEPGDEHETDVSPAADPGHWFERSSFETTRLDGSSGAGAWQPPATSSALGYQSPDFRLQHESAFSAPEASTDTACATLLAVDEPLGDVLFDDEAVSLDSLALSETPSSDALGLEFMEAGVAQVAEVQPAISTQFDLVETVTKSSPEALPELLSGFEENAVPLESATVDQTPSLEADQQEPVATSPLSDTQPVSQDVEPNLDWTTPRAAAYSTAQLDSVVMPADAAEYLAENAVEETPQPESAEEATFKTPAMWTEEEARFTPIDIEAVSVEEAAAFAPGPAADAGAVETGFAFSSATFEDAAAASKTPVASSTNGHSDTDVGAALSSSAIDEIVRRVVAEMSESVVREVAWEVVPDCVERVIEQLTRESLSKRA